MKDSSSSCSSDLMSAEPSRDDFLKESRLLRGQSNGKVFRMTVSNKGKESLVREGYMYRLDHAGKDKLSWRCSARGCPAHLKTDHSKETIVQDNEKQHTHPADAHKFERQLLRIACKRKAVLNCNTRPQDIISDEMTKLSNLNISPKNTKFLQLAMYRERKKAFTKMPPMTRSGKKLPQAERKMSNQSKDVTSISQPHIPNPPSNFFPHPPSTFEPHFDMLTDGDDSEFHHHDPHHHPQPPLPHHHHHHHHESNNLQPIPQQMHPEQHQPPPSHPPPPLQLHQQQLLQQQQLEGSLPQILFNHLSSEPVVVASTSTTGNSNINNFSSCALEAKIACPESTGAAEEDYFRCYADVRIHEDMLNDKVRTLAYRRALQENRSQLQGATVLDVGAGTGILSHFAVQAGAAKVYAVEASCMALFAEKIVKENNASGVITVVQSKIENADIPIKVDAIISEWMGYNLLYESMLPSVLIARDRFLKPCGEMYPHSAALYLAPVIDREFLERIKSWKQMKSLYGVSMESLVSLTRDALTVRADSQHLDIESVLANPCQLCHFDLKTMTLQDANQVKAEFSFRCYGHNTMHGFVTWFTVSFPGSVTLDTSPYALRTHWGQTVMYLKTPVNVKQDSEIKGTYKMSPSPGNHRFWNIEIDFQVNRGRKYSQQWQCAD